MPRELEKLAELGPAEKSQLNHAGPTPERPILRQPAQLSNTPDAFFFSVFRRSERSCPGSRALVPFYLFADD